MHYIIHYSKLIIIVICILAVIVLFIALSPHTAQTPSSPSVVIPTPLSEIEQSLPVPLSLNDVIIGSTTVGEIKALPDFKGTETLPENTTGYLFGSKTQIHLNEVITKNGVAVFKRERINLDGTNQPTDTYYLQKYGTPEDKIVGSYFYGDNATYFIYPSKGLAFIANETSGTVFELQFFEPTTIEEYKILYGSDIHVQTSQVRY